jgi:hypothetical protein
MSKSAPAPLTMPVIPKKGEATPAISSLEDPVVSAVVPTPLHEPPKVSSSRLASRVQPTIAVTVRLDEARYERMKTWGTARRVTNQEVIVAALDRFFGLSDQEKEDGIARVRR